MNDRKLIAVYGSLRVGEYNYERFKLLFKNIKYLFTDRIQGFKLYSLGDYPGIKLTGKNEDSVVFDILEVSQECFNQINLMEIGANYKPMTLKMENENHGKIICYEYLGKVSENNHIPSGDWSEYLKNTFVNTETIVTV